MRRYLEEDTAKKSLASRSVRREATAVRPSNWGYPQEPRIRSFLRKEIPGSSGRAASHGGCEHIRSASKQKVEMQSPRSWPKTTRDRRR